MRAIIGVEVPDYQIGQEVSIYFKDTMMIKGVVQEPKMGWNNHQIACMLADLFGDACACNYNGIDEWLGELCDFKDTCCPNPVGVACWEQFLKYSQSRYTECGYEVRDKNALQEPKMGHWIMPVQDDGMSDPIYYQVRCSKCGFDLDPQTWHMELHQYGADKYCPKCGSKMYEDKGVLEQLAEKQNNLSATNKAWSDVIEKNGYVN